MWYVMQVRTGTEENIRCQCQRIISSDVLERCFIPYYQQKKRFRGEWHIQERILFPGYVFLIARNLEILIDNLKQVIGLTRLIGTGDEIVPLSQEEIDLLLRMGSDSFETYCNGIGMCSQLLGCGKLNNIFVNITECRPGIINNT